MKKLATICHEQTLIPLLDAEELSHYLPLQKALNEIQPLTQLPNEQFSEVYTQLITRFFAGVQMIPELIGGRLGSLFEEGLKRAFLAVKLQQEDSSLFEDALVTYAIFSATLLLDLRKILANKRIMLVDATGRFLSEWSPFDHFMYEMEASHYQVRQYHRPLTQLSPYMTILLARRIMPEAGFLWLAQDVAVFNKWLAMLCSDEKGAAEFWHILSAVKLRMQQQPESKPKFIMPVEVLQPTEHALAEKFWTWLKNALANGEIQEPDAVHVVDKLVFLDVPKIFQIFCQAQLLPLEQWQSVHQQFLELGIATSARDEQEIAPGQLMLYLTEEEITAKKSVKKEVVEDHAVGKLPKGFFKQTFAQSKQEALKQQEQKERDYRQQESLLVEQSWFSKVSRKYETQQRLQETTRKRKRTLRRIQLTRLLTRLSLKRHARLFRRA